MANRVFSKRGSSPAGTGQWTDDRASVARAHHRGGESAQPGPPGPAAAPRPIPEPPPGPNQGGRHDTSHLPDTPRSTAPTCARPAGRFVLCRLPAAVALAAVLMVVFAAPAFADAGGGAPTLSG